MSSPKSGDPQGPPRGDRRTVALSAILAVLVIAFGVGAIAAYHDMRSQSESPAVVLPVFHTPGSSPAAGSPKPESAADMTPPETKSDRKGPSTTRPELAADIERVIVLRKGVLRGGPAADAPELARLAPGDRLERLAPTPVLGFVKVRRDGIDGWIWNGNIRDVASTATADP